jgi:hypothetical protein
MVDLETGATMDTGRSQTCVVVSPRRALGSSAVAVNAVGVGGLPLLAGWSNHVGMRHPRRAIAAAVFVAAVANCSSGATTKTTPATTRLAGRSLFVIRVPPCGDRASCASAIVVGARTYVVSGDIKPQLAAAGRDYAIGRGSLTYDLARTIPGEDPSLILGVHNRATARWLAAVRGGAGATATAALCRVVPNVAGYSQCQQ